MNVSFDIIAIDIAQPDQAWVGGGVVSLLLFFFAPN